MEIVLIVAIVAVAAAGLFVALTFNKRTRQTTAPLIDAAVSDMTAKLTVTADDLRRELRAISEDLRQDREQQRLDGQKIQGRLDHADSQISGMASQFMTELDAIKRRGEQIGERQDQMGADLQRLATRHGGGEPGSLRTSDGVTPARPAAVVGRLYAERLQFSLVRPPGSDRVRIAVERSVGELPPDLLGDRSMDRLGEAASDYAATRWGDPAFALVTERWITQNTFPETAAAEVCNRIGARLNTIVSRPLDAIGTEIHFPAPVAATGAGIGADLVLQPVTRPLGEAAAFFEIVGVVVAVATGLHPLALAAAKMLARDQFHQVLARGIGNAARTLFAGAELPSRLQPTRGREGPAQGPGVTRAQDDRTRPHRDPLPGPRRPDEPRGPSIGGRGPM